MRRICATFCMFGVALWWSTGAFSQTASAPTKRGKGIVLSPEIRGLTSPDTQATQGLRNPPAPTQVPLPVVIDRASAWIYDLPHYVVALKVNYHPAPAEGDIWFTVTVSLDPENLESPDRAVYRLRWGASPEARASGASILSTLSTALVHQKQVTISWEPGTVVYGTGAQPLTPAELLIFEIGSVQMFQQEIECVVWYGGRVIPLTEARAGTRCVGGKLVD
jgi:hypothetical protein